MKRALFLTVVGILGVVACRDTSHQAETKPVPVPVPVVVEKPATPGSAAPATTNPPAADPWSKAPPPKDPLPRPLFWSIEKDGITSYALGTIHTGVDAEARLPAIVWAKLDAAKAFAMETNLSDPALMKILECNNCSLRRDLGEKYWTKLEKVITPQVAAQLEPMKPMVAATMLSMRGLPQTTQMDTLLLARAQRANKPIVYLEEAAAEAAILEKWMDVKALKAMLDDMEGSLQHTKEMLAAYLAGDEVRMVKLSEDERTQALAHGYTAKEFEESMQDMLYGRNASWIAGIEKMHAAGGGFIAVGAMHLVGPKNVLELLAKDGYKITRVVP